ncbi:MAG: DUF2829 domain-containing protein [Psychrobacter alimentarius]
MTDMKRFNALTKVTAKPMTRQEYNDLRGWDLPADEDGSDDGYLTVDINADSNFEGYDGHVSWKPKAMFDDQFYECTAGQVSYGPADPDHELTDDEVATLASGGSLCDCCEFVQVGGDCPIEEGDEFDFGSAIYLLKMGKKVARKGWNGAGMYVYYVPAASYPAQRNSKSTMAGEFPDDMVPYREYLALKTAQGDVATWAPSVSDALATDWCLA